MPTLVSLFISDQFARTAEAEKTPAPIIPGIFLFLSPACAVGTVSKLLSAKAEKICVLFMVIPSGVWLVLFFTVAI